MKTILGIDVGMTGALAFYDGDELIWKDIKGYEGFYQISNTGLVKSVERKIKNRWSYRILKPRVLKGKYDKDGYCLVDLSKNSSVTTLRVHRLVLETFLSVCPNDMECRHLDGIRTNNNLKNLAWGTKKENALDKKKHGTEIYGERNANYKSNRNRDGGGRWY